MDEKLTRVEHLPRVSTENTAEAAAELRDWLSDRTGAALRYICQTAFTIEETRGKTENVIGAAHLPIGVAGPLIIKGDNANGTFYVPMATTEGTLVATYLHGMRATAKAGGVTACVLDDMLDITPAFVVHDLAQARALVAWVQDHMEAVRAAVESTTRHGHLVEVRPHVFGRHVLLQFFLSTGDAMGMNMINIAVNRAGQMIADNFPIERWYLRSNYSSDKKAAGINLFRPYGKEVLADVTLPGYVVRNFLGTTAEELCAFQDAAIVGSMQAGMLGFNAHFANGLAAVYIACGQDPAQIVNASIGFVHAERVNEDGLHISVRLPNVVVGTVGGGTSLPTQRECLGILGCEGEGKARKFAEIIGSTLLCGELGISSALASGRFAQAHEQNRGQLKQVGPDAAKPVP
ncbi:MAG TPA: hydroxymethylglutaryl-CoA reductase [Myxococcota bacterium]|nr:hydroxymethylglutaryl-CoA reductase [Myxococcota bacterium]